MIYFSKKVGGMIIKPEKKRLLGWIFVLFDLVTINLCIALSWWLRFESGFVPVYKEYQSYSAYFDSGLLVSFIWIFVFAFLKIYEIDIRQNYKQYVVNIVKGSLLASFITMALSFLYRGYSYSRLTFAISVVLVTIVLIISHWSFKRILKGVVARGTWLSKFLIIGTGQIADLIFGSIQTDTLLAKSFVGFIDTEKSKRYIPDIFIKGNLKDLKRIIIQEGIDQVILAESSFSEKSILSILYECRKENVLFTLVPEFHNLLRGNVYSETLGNITLLTFPDIALKGWQKVSKRLFDLFFSVLFIIISLPFTLYTAIAIKLTSRGSVFFKQKRVGRNGRIFNMFKFRTMVINADELKPSLTSINDSVGPIFKIKKDPRITIIGRILRRYSLDELPQLINVLIDQMSLVGPRPPLISEVKEYEKWQLRRIDTVPGMTGLWQVSGRSDLPFDKMAKLDLYYIKNWSIWLDIYILIKTIPAILSGKGAY